MLTTALVPIVFAVNSELLARAFFATFLNAFRKRIREPANALHNSCSNNAGENKYCPFGHRMINKVVLSLMNAGLKNARLLFVRNMMALKHLIFSFAG